MSGKTSKLARSAIRLSEVSVPLFSSRVQAGFPSPAEDASEGPLDLNRLIIKNPATTFFVRVEGDSMEGAGIFSEDILVVDRSKEAQSGDIVVAVVFDELTVKRLVVKGGTFLLVAENEAYEPIEITEEMDSMIWGVVTHSVRTL